MTGKLLAYHLKSPRVPQFENHCRIRFNQSSAVETASHAYAKCVMLDVR